MRKECIRVIYYCCFFTACFASLGTFASFLLARNEKSLNKDVNDYLKASCPALLVLSFVVMWLVRCFTSKPRNSTDHQAGLNEGIEGIEGRSNAICINGGYVLGSLPSYDEVMNSTQLYPNEPPPDYEDITRQRWKPEDLTLRPYGNQHRTTSGGQIFSITLPERVADPERGLAPDGVVVFQRDAVPERGELERVSYTELSSPTIRDIVAERDPISERGVI